MLGFRTCWPVCGRVVIGPPDALEAAAGVLGCGSILQHNLALIGRLASGGLGVAMLGTCEPGFLFPSAGAISMPEMRS